MPIFPELSTLEKGTFSIVGLLLVLNIGIKHAVEGYGKYCFPYPQHMQFPIPNSTKPVLTTKQSSPHPFIPGFYLSNELNHGTYFLLLWLFTTSYR